jgi:hypothetical protein
MPFSRFENLPRAGTHEAVVSNLLRSCALKQKGEFGLGIFGDLEVCGRRSVQVGGDFGEDWYSIWSIRFATELCKKTPYRIEGRLKFLGGCKLFRPEESQHK